MTGLVISVANMKGGVGKTTIAVGLAQCFSRRRNGGRGGVLVIDLDAQANASFWLSGDLALTNWIERGETIDAYLEDRIIHGQNRSLAKYAHAVMATEGEFGVSVVPSSPELRIVERQLLYALSDKKKSFREIEGVIGDLIKTEIEALRSAYDVILFDTAPGISPLTEAAFAKSDIVVVPTIPDFISNLGLEAFCRSVWWGRSSAPKTRKTPWVVANMVRPNYHHQVMLSEMRAESDSPDPGFRMFKCEIPSLTEIESSGGRMRERNEDGLNYFSDQTASAFDGLAEEILHVAKATAG